MEINSQTILDTAVERISELEREILMLRAVIRQQTIELEKVNQSEQQEEGK